jgi:hypothetical protein
MAQADSVIKKLANCIKKQKPKANKKGSEMILTLRMSLLKILIPIAFTLIWRKTLLRVKTLMPTSANLIGAAIRTITEKTNRAMARQRTLRIVN